MPIPLTTPLPLPKPLPLPQVHMSTEGPGIAAFWSKPAGVTAIRARWQNLSQLLRHQLVQHASVYVLAGLASVPQDDGGEPTVVLHFYVGEGGNPPCRLPDHRRNPDLSFVDTIYLLTSERFTKSDVVYLQKRVAELVRASGRGCIVQGCAPTSQPINRSDALENDMALGFGLTLLQAAGCPWVEPQI